MKDLHLRAIQILEAIEKTERQRLTSIVLEAKFEEIFGAGNTKRPKPYEKRIVRLKECYKETCNKINLENHQQLNQKLNK